MALDRGRMGQREQVHQELDVVSRKSRTCSLMVFILFVQ